MSRSLQGNRIWMSNGGANIPQKAIAIVQKKTKDVDEQVPVPAKTLKYFPFVDEIIRALVDSPLPRFRLHGTLKQIADCRFQPRHAKRLRHIGVHSRRATALPILRRSMRSKRHNWNHVTTNVLPCTYDRSCFQTVHLRHLDVENDEIEGLGVRR